MDTAAFDALLAERARDSRLKAAEHKVHGEDGYSTRWQVNW